MTAHEREGNGQRSCHSHANNSFEGDANDQSRGQNNAGHSYDVAFTSTSWPPVAVNPRGHVAHEAWKS